MRREVDAIPDHDRENACPAGGGPNVVNVILVDFRGFDMVGEIVVPGIAALTTFALAPAEALLHGRAARRLATNRVVQAPKGADRHPPMMVVATRMMMPISLMLGGCILLRGHDEPGGGFIDGPIVAVALLMQDMASGFARSQERQRIPSHTVIGPGVVLAGLTGIGARVAGRPFLTPAFTHLRLPPIRRSGAPRRCCSTSGCSWRWSAR